MTAPLREWQRERFPLRNGIFFTLFYATALLAGRVAAGGAAVFFARDLPGLAAVWAFFLMLRVFDEHKDFAADAVAHPGRALQRGVVTLPQLARLGAAALVLQLVVSLWLDGGVGTVTAHWLAVLAWSLLMAREFFAPAWLRAHMLPYALSHMAVMPLVALWVAAMASAAAPRSPVLWALAAFAFLGPLAFEVGRKIRAPEDEHPFADSYTQSLGARRASALLAAVVVAAAGAALVLVRVAVGEVRPLAAIVLGAAVLAAGVATARFAARPTPAAAKRAETATAAAALAAYVVVIVAIVVTGGRP